MDFKRFDRLEDGTSSVLTRNLYMVCKETPVMFSSFTVCIKHLQYVKQKLK